MEKNFNFDEIFKSLEGLDVEQLKARIVQLEKERGQKGGERKKEVLNVLKDWRHKGGIGILEISKILNCSSRNVSSYLTYLRKDGYEIWTVNEGKKLLKLDEKAEAEENKMEGLKEVKVRKADK